MIVKIRKKRKNKSKREMTIRQVKVFFFTIAAIAAVGCKPTVPSKYISPDEMEDVLYDYYMSQAMANMDAKDGRMEYNRRTYFLAVLKKIGRAHV